MPKKQVGPPVRIIGSRELHQKLTSIMRDVEENDARFVLTVHGKPKAVLVGTSTCLKYIKTATDPDESLLNLQLTALMGGTDDKTAGL